MGLLWFGLALASNHRHLLPLHGPCPRKQQSGASSLRPSCMRGQRPARGLHPRLLESQRRLRWSAPGQCSQPAVCAAASRCAARMHLAFQPLACAARSARLACASAATPGHACSSARGPHLHQQRQQTCLYLALGCTVKHESSACLQTCIHSMEPDASCIPMLMPLPYVRHRASACGNMCSSRGQGMHHS